MMSTTAKDSNVQSTISTKDPSSNGDADIKLPPDQPLAETALSSRLQHLVDQYSLFSRITPKHTICFSDSTIVDVNYWSTTWKRYWYGESRQDLLDKVNKIVKETKDFLEDKTQTLTDKTLLVTHIKAAMFGFNNLTQTYASDSRFVSTDPATPSIYEQYLMELKNLIAIAK